MKVLWLAKGNDQWVVKYDEERHTLTVEGPGPQGERIHQWLTTPKKTIDPDTGQLTSVIPTHSWAYLVQVIEVDLYNDLGISVLWDRVEDQA